MDKQQLTAKLKECEELFNDGIFNQDDFDREKRALLDQWRAAGLANTKPSIQRAEKTLMDLEADMEVGPAHARFVLEKELGRGGMASVWKAKDLAESDRRSRDCYKALKFLHPDFSHSAAHHKRLQREADNAKQLRHPNIVGVYGFEQGKDGLLFLVMDYLQGRDLFEVLEDEGKGEGLPWERVYALMNPVADALHYAHQTHQLVHRDLKPANLYLTQQDQLKILDFGLSEQLKQSGSQLGMAADNRSGTKVYWAPEVCTGGKLHISRDIYAFSVVVYELLTGRYPFAEAIVCNRPPKLKPSKPEGLSARAWQVLSQGLAYAPDQRPDSIAALWEALHKQQYNPLNHYPNIDGWNSKQVKDWQSETAKAFGYQNMSYQDRLADGSLGPRMVILPNGIYHMGSPEDEPEREPWDKGNEKPHKVQIAAFAIGQTAVTFADYQLYCQATGIDLPDDEGWGKGRRPVINISWHEAYDYAQWLSSQTGKPYRLLSEAEWEYACRAGTTTPFHTGQTIQTSQANFDGNYTYNGSEKGDYLRQTVEVGRYAPNAFGLYDMHGNVSEWVGSAYETNYLGQEQQLTDKGSSALRVVRGGSWYIEPWWLRSAFRVGDTPDFRSYDVGFRLAQDLTL